MLPLIMQHIHANRKSHSCEDFVNDVGALLDIISRNLAAVLYVLRYPDFVRTLFSILSDIVSKNVLATSVEAQQAVGQGENPNETPGGSESHCINTLLRALCVLLGGSQPNKPMWKDITKDLLLEEAINNAGSGLAEMHASNFFDLYLYLLVIHDCPIKVGKQVDEVIAILPEEAKKEISSMSPVDHLQVVLNSFNLELVYTEYCSCPGCGRKDVGHTFKRCSRCKLARYCSQKCQAHHWTKAAHKNLCNHIVFSDAKNDIDDLPQQEKVQVQSVDDIKSPGPVSQPSEATPGPQPIIQEGIVDDTSADEDGVADKDILLVMSQASVSRADAVSALKNHQNDILKAVMQLLEDATWM